MISLLDAAYRVDVASESWLQGLADAAPLCFPGSMGAACWLYERAGESMRPLAVRWSGEGRLAVDLGSFRVMHRATPPDVIQAVLSGPPRCALGSDQPGFRNPAGAIMAYLRRRGIIDVINLTATTASPLGCCVGIALGRPMNLASAVRRKWGRVATHLEAAIRLRLRLERGTGGAPVSPSGDVYPAKVRFHEEASVSEIHAAIAHLDRVRGPLRQTPDWASAEWRGLVAARWRLFDDFESGGHRYMIARRTAADAPGPLALTPRERQVISRAVLGHTNKEIAYDLGVAHSTVGVLVSRAMKKLGASTRDEALQAYRESQTS